MKDKHKKKLGRKVRLQKGKEWLLSYDRSQKRTVRNYGKYFHVDIRIAAEDLQKLGVSDAMIQYEEIIRIRKQKSMQKKNHRQEKYKRPSDMYEDCDDCFAYIAGYTDGGAAYGVTWEEAGIDPALPFKEKVRRY